MLVCCFLLLLASKLRMGFGRVAHGALAGDWLVLPKKLRISRRAGQQKRLRLTQCQTWIWQMRIACGVLDVQRFYIISSIFLITATTYFKTLILELTQHEHILIAREVKKEL